MLARVTGFVKRMGNVSSVCCCVNVGMAVMVDDDGSDDDQCSVLQKGNSR